MTELSKNAPEKKRKSRERLDRLMGNAERAEYNPRYSKFIRWMRLILPLIAIGMIAVVFSWGSFTTEDIVKAKDPVEVPKTIGKNELLNPRFESKDDKNQPYTITAKRAIQGETNDNLVVLEEPIGDIQLKSGRWIAVRSHQGAYRQDTERLLLKGNVEIFHDQGYQLNTEEMNLDLASNIAWAETPVTAHGPAGVLTSSGLQANSDNGLLIFTGPAKLVLNQSVSGFNLRGRAP